MSKFDKIWEYVSDRNESTLILTFDEIESIAGLPIDHSFLKYKKELSSYGFAVEKISMKDKTVKFIRLK
jgi:hypothetical protein